MSGGNTVFSTGGGTVSAMTISNGASVTTAQDYIGENGTTNVTVTGAGTRWTENASQIIGDNGGTGSLTIANGATVNVSNGVFIGNNGGGVGSVLVTGAGSTYNVLFGVFLVVDVRNVGSLTVANGGTVNATGGILVDFFSNSGTVNIGAAAGQTPVAPGTINDNGLGINLNAVGSTIVFNHTSTNYTFSPIIFGAGSVVVDAGTTIFAVTEAYTGSTTINGGTLEVDGSIASSKTVTVNSGGTLTGVGTVDLFPVGSTTINAGGTLAPGTPGAPGTFMTIGGRLVFQPGATYAVSLNPSSSTYAVVGSTASLAGTVSASFAPGSYVAHQYDILRSAGRGGTTFSGLTTNNPNFSASLSYTATDVLLNLTAATLGNGTSLGGNQQNVAGAINGFFNNGGTLPPAFGAIFGLTGSALSTALTQLSGEAATDAQAGAFQLMDQFLNLMIDPSVNGRGGGASSGAMGFAPERADHLPPEIALAYARVFKAPPVATPVQTWNVWGAAFGGSANISGDPLAGTSDVTARTYGYVSGADYRITRDTLVGFAIGGGGTNWSVAQGLGAGRSDAFQAGLYAKSFFGPAYVAASLGFADHWMTTNRVSAMFDQLTASFKAQSFGGRVEGGYRFAVAPASGITPYAAVQAQSFHTPSYQETDVTGGGFGLAFNARTATDTRSEIGSRFDRLATVGGYLLMLQGRLAWAHDWISDPSLGAVFQTLPGSSFIVNGARPAHDYALTTFGADLHLTPKWMLSAKFEGELAERTQSYSGVGKVTYSW